MSNNRFKIISIDFVKKNIQGQLYVFGTPFLMTENRVANTEDIHNLIEQKGLESAVSKLSGMFSIVYFEKNGWPKLIQGPFSDLRDILFFWNEKEKEWLITDSLVLLKNRCKNELTLNEKSICDFLNFGYVLGNNTLIENIYKLTPVNSITLKDDGVFVCVKNNYSISYKDIHERSYIDFVGSLLPLSLLDNFAITLSSGFDSNALLYSLLNRFNNVRALTVGGAQGRNEIPMVESICEEYSKVTLHSSVLNDSALDNFPTIVYRLEGTMFERGCFLQYELSKMAKKIGVGLILGGDGADQAMSASLDLQYEFIGEFDAPLNNFWHQYPQEVLRNIVVKKSGMLMTNMGIECYYPFLNLNFVSFYKNVGFAGKEYHKNKISECLPVKITNKLKKLGGSTNLSFIFEGKYSYDYLNSLLMASRYNNFNIICLKNYVGLDDEFELVLKKLYLAIFEQIFCKGLNINFDENVPEKLEYFLERIKNEIS